MRPQILFLMEPSGKELTVYFHRNRTGLICAGLVFLALFGFVTYFTWISPIGPFGTSGHGGGPFNYYITKFLGLPCIGLIVFYSFKTAMSRDSKIVELRVGDPGIWRRAITGSEVFIPWSAIHKIAIVKSDDESLLVFEVEDILQFHSLAILHRGVYLTAGSSPIPLPELAAKFCRYAEFKSRYKGDA